MVQREEMYFEPRCVGSDLRIRWYGEQYSAPELERHYEETVYIRDSGKELMVYSMEADCWDEKAKIKATFSLIIVPQNRTSSLSGTCVYRAWYLCVFPIFQDHY